MVRSMANDLHERVYALTQRLEEFGVSIEEILELCPFPAAVVGSISERTATIDGANALAVEWLKLSVDELQTLTPSDFVDADTRARLRDMRTAAVEAGMTHVSLNDFSSDTLIGLRHPISGEQLSADIAAVRVNGTRAMVVAVPMGQTAQLMSELEHREVELVEALRGREEAVLAHKHVEFASRARLQGNRDSLLALCFGVTLINCVAVIGLAVGESDSLITAKDVSLVAIGGIVSSLRSSSEGRGGT